jgi:thiol-disulfide isomerase/thioredoxin
VDVAKSGGLASRWPIFVALGFLLVSPAIVWSIVDALRGTPEVQPVSMAAVAKRVQASQGQVSVLYVYASWCPACEQSLPTLNRVVRRFEDDVAFTVVSVDKDLDALQDMLNETGAAFEPLCVPAARDGALSGLLEGLGAKPIEAVPYGVVFDADGNVYREWTGWRSMDAWDGALTEVL